MATTDNTAPLLLTDPHRSADTLWALVDVTLLFLVVALSSDMLLQLGPIRALSWMLCYALTLLRVAMTLPEFLGMVARNRVLLAFPLACLASVVWSADRGGSLVSAVQLSMTFTIAAFLGWRYSTAILTKCLAIVLTVACLLSLLHWATGVFPWPVHTSAGGLAGLFSHKNMLGQRALFGVIALLAVLLMSRREAAGGFKLFALVALALSMLALGLAQSMTAVLLLPPAAGLLVLLCLRRIPAGVATALVGLTLVIVALGPVMLAVAGVDPVGTVLDGVGKDATLTGRTIVWDIAQQVIGDHPLLGVGYGAFWSAGEFANLRLATQHAGAVTSASFHNFVFEILVSAGWPGLIAMLALLAAGVRRLGRLYLGAGSVAAACGLSLFLASIACALLGPSLYRAHEIMMMLVVMYTVSAGEDLRQLGDAGEEDETPPARRG